ncbi:unnamed protein product [Urochloa decumbens]|uniref:WAT1-related protein n=2 Tax=Urochloa decumbens TaxID=240449 RepID=A0ABC9GP24_9POAL
MKKAYAVAMVIQAIMASTVILSKAAFDRGLSTFVYVFYRLAAASLFLTPLAILLERCVAKMTSNKKCVVGQVFLHDLHLNMQERGTTNVSPAVRLLAKMFLYALVGNAVSMSLYNASLRYTSATVASAMCNSIPAITFFLALLMRMEVIKMRSSSGMAKIAGITLCLAGALVIALYTGQSLSPLNRHRVLSGHGDKKQGAEHVSKGVWIMGTFLMLLSCVAWALWIVFQGVLLKEDPNKLLATLIQCVFGAIQSGVVAVVVERGHPSRWKLGLDVSLLAVAYSGIVGTGICFYLQTWCVGMKGPVFLAMWNPMSLMLTVLCSSLLGETVHLGSILGGILLVGGLYCVLWGKNKEETRAAMASDLQEQSREQEEEIGKNKVDQQV